jgi:acetyl-CoA carboxylase alpha subunit
MAAALSLPQKDCKITTVSVIDIGPPELCAAILFRDIGPPELCAAILLRDIGPLELCAAFLH